MLPFEDQVADYVKATGNRVLYRVTPVFVDMEMVARGVHMEAWSVEDSGKGVCFSVFVFNKQPGIVIDYKNGESHLAEENPAAGGTEYILNTNSHKFHRPDCGYAADIKAENRQDYNGSRDILVKQGYSPCGGCKP
jgi:DNA-entry nuclease